MTKEDRKRQAEELRLYLEKECKVELKRLNEVKDKIAKQSERVKELSEEYNTLNTKKDSLQSEADQLLLLIEKRDKELSTLRQLVQTNQIALEAQKQDLAEARKLDEIAFQKRDSQIKTLEQQLLQKGKEITETLDEAKRIKREAVKEAQNAENRLLEAQKQEKACRELDSSLKSKLDAIEAQNKALQSQKTDIEGLIQKNEGLMAKLDKKEAFLTNKEGELNLLQKDLDNKSLNLSIWQNELLQLDKKVKYLIETSKVKV